MKAFQISASALFILTLDVSIAESGQISVINPAAGGGLAMSPVISSPPAVSMPAAGPNTSPQSVTPRSISSDTRLEVLQNTLLSIETSSFTSEQKREILSQLLFMLNDERLPSAVHSIVNNELHKFEN